MKNRLFVMMVLLSSFSAKSISPELARIGANFALKWGIPSVCTSIVFKKCVFGSLASAALGAFFSIESKETMNVTNPRAIAVGLAGAVVILIVPPFLTWKATRYAGNWAIRSYPWLSKK